MHKSETGLAAPQVGLSELIGRVRKLERQNRMWKVGTVLTALVLALAVAAGTKAQQEREDILRAKTVESEDFVLKDATGITRGELTAKDGSSVLRLYNANGTVIFSTAPHVTTESR
jgi:hypothetical protein